MRYYDELARYEREGFDIIVDITSEDISPRGQFDWSEEEMDQLMRDIEFGKYDWFMLRVRVFVEGNELGSHYLGGCLYEDPMEVLTDGTAEDCISEALREAKKAVYPLMRKLQAINEEIEREGIA